MKISHIPFFVISGLVLATLIGCGAKQPGTRLTFQIDTKTVKNWPKAQTERLAIMEKAKQIAEKQSPNATVAVKDDDKLIVTLNGVTDPQTVASAISAMSSTADIEFYHLKNVRSRNNAVAEWAISPDGGGGKAYIFTGPNGQKIDSLKQPADLMAKVIDPNKNPPVLTGQDIMPNAKASFNARQQPVIMIEFNQHGTETFRDFTRRNVHEYLAVFYGGRLLTAPMINEPITGGKAEISGFDSLKEARETANALNSGSQVVPFRAIKREVVKG